MTAPQLYQYVQGKGSVSADNLNTFEQTCDTAAQLRTFIGTIGNQVFMRGGLAIADGLQGVFYWNASGTGPDDGVNNIVPPGASSGCWTRIPPSELAGYANVLAYGADPTGVTSSQSAIARAWAAHPFIYFPPGKYLVTSTFIDPWGAVASGWIGAGSNAVTVTSTAGTLDMIVNTSTNPIYSGLTLTRSVTPSSGAGLNCSSTIGAGTLSDLIIENQFVGLAFGQTHKELLAGEHRGILEQLAGADIGTIGLLDAGLDRIGEV